MDADATANDDLLSCDCVGVPKGVMLSHWNILSNVLASNKVVSPPSNLLPCGVSIALPPLTLPTGLNAPIAGSGSFQSSGILP